MSSPVRFEVEVVIDASGRAIVLARLLAPAGFVVNDSSRLNGAAVRSFDMPRAKDASGNQRTDLFGFVLVRREDLSKFTVGQRVELKTGVIQGR